MRPRAEAAAAATSPVRSPRTLRGGASRPQEDAPVRIRVAEAIDLPALVALESAAFSSDRIAERSWKRLLQSASAVVGLAEQRGATIGAIVMLYRAKSSVARVYSIAVAQTSRGQGVAQALMEFAIERARRDGAAALNLETRVDNLKAQSLFRRLGFTPFGRHAGYYADGVDALRLRKYLWNLALAADAVALRSPFYGQTLDFTCGPCSLMMAMAALDRATVIDRAAEVRIWREATTVFLAAGHGGCGPFGLAAAAIRRGFEATVYAPPGRTLFIDSVRDERKKEVIELVEADFRAEIAETSAQVVHAPVSVQRIVEHLAAGGVPIVLISLWRLHGEKGPHWVVVTGFDGAVFRVLDPMSDATAADPGISVSVDEFRRIARYGRHRQTAAVVLFKGN